jgi:5'-deoxynucleotidase YfbR-like HD superfamily hydrolase
MNDLEKALDALPEEERSIIDAFANEYLYAIKDSAFRKAWTELRLASDEEQRSFMDSDEFSECLHQYQTDTAYWFALRRRSKEIESAIDHQTYMAITNRYDEVA